MTAIYAVYSETGGVTKTTTAVSLGVCWALSGRRVTVVDLDPRAAATKWLGVQPAESWRHVGAILAEPDPTGWLDDLSLPSLWPKTPTLRIVPSARGLSNREATREDHAEVRLKRAMEGTDAEVIVLDLPNRQGGPIVQNALNAADYVLYAAKLDEDGLDGIDGAVHTVRGYLAHRRQLGAPDDLAEAGVVVGMVRDTIMTLDARRALQVMSEQQSPPVLRPLIPERVVVREARAAGDYYGWYSRGEVVHNAYEDLARQLPLASR